MGSASPGSIRILVIVFCCIAWMAGRAGASSDPDVDVAIKTVEGVDGHTKDERARYIAALEKYADNRQKLLAGLGKLVESNQPEVDGAWDQFADAGLKSLDELKSAAPAEKTRLEKFYQAETATWETLKKINLPAAEEAETKLRKTVETVTPVVAEKMKEIVEEDKKGDEEFRKRADRRKAIFDLVVAGIRVVNKAVNPNEMLKLIVEDVLKNIEAYRGGLLELRVAAREKAALLKKYLQVRAIAGEIDKAVDAATEDSMKKLAAAKSDLELDPIDDEAAVSTQAEGWAKVVEVHFNETLELVKKFNETVEGKLIGNADNDTKSLLGDYETFKAQIEIWEDEADAITEGLNELEKRIEDFVDGDLKRAMKDGLAKCKDILKECNSLRSDIKSEYESALGDAGLK